MNNQTAANHQGLSSPMPKTGIKSYYRTFGKRVPTSNGPQNGISCETSKLYRCSADDNRSRMFL